MNLSLLLRAASREHRDRPALDFGAESVQGSVTYGEMDAEADRVAAGLRALGVAHGDRVAIAMGNIPHFCYAYFGILRAGGIAVPLNPTLTARELGRILSDSGARVVLTAPPAEEAVADVASGVSTVDRVVSVSEWESALDGKDHADEETSADDVAVLAYTSGTTGEPKGAMLTHGNLVANLDQQMAIPEAHVTRDDVLYLSLPLFHIYGLNVTLGLMVMNAARGLLIERFEPVRALRLIEERGVTVVFGAPPMYVAWVGTPGADQYDLSKVRLAVSGAAPLAIEVLEDFNNLFGIDIYEGYGLTETAPTLTSNRMAGEPRAGSVGTPLAQVELRLVDDAGKDVELGDPGEIVVRGPNVFKGYWGRDELTREAFLADGWFRTGDIAVQDEEGYIYLVDRKRDLIIVSGFNVFPSEVEEALLEHPAVEQAAVIGAPHPHTGEAVRAYAVVAEGRRVGEEELIEHVRARLARFKCPESIELVDELPTLLTGKVLRRELRT
ncbi:MAG: long-chain-fatty-acid--CoA ligase [Actinomycetota bacterium]